MIKGFQVDGYQEVMRAFRVMRRTDQANVILGLGDCAELVFIESQKEVPVDKGHLKKSGYWQTATQWVGEQATADIGYAMPYAVYVHEDLAKAHKPPTKAKYLSDPFKRLRPKLVRIMVARLQGTGGKVVMTQVRSTPGP